MRFRLTMAGVLAAGLAAAASAGASLNPQHAGLQVALRAQGLYLGPIDAIIGPKTVAAVRAFQRGHGLRVTGIADIKTRRELGPLGTPLFGSRTLAHGEFGWDVAVMQFLLNKHGVRVPVNAYMDRPTVTGVRRYQRLMHLPADGVTKNISPGFGARAIENTPEISPVAASENTCSSVPSSLLL